MNQLYNRCQKRKSDSIDSERKMSIANIFQFPLVITALI